MATRVVEENVREYLQGVPPGRQQDQIAQTAGIRTWRRISLLHKPSDVEEIEPVKVEQVVSGLIDASCGDNLKDGMRKDCERRESQEYEDLDFLDPVKLVLLEIFADHLFLLPGFQVVSFDRLPTLASGKVIPEL